jgi:hypothetical protein
MRQDDLMVEDSVYKTQHNCKWKWNIAIIESIVFSQSHSQTAANHATISNIIVFILRLSTVGSIYCGMNLICCFVLLMYLLKCCFLWEWWQARQMMTSIQLPLGSPFVDMYSCRLVAWKRHILRCLYLVPFEFVPTLGFVDEATGMAWVVPGCFSVLIDIALTYS